MKHKYLKHWLDSPQTLKRFWLVIFVLLIFSVFAELFVTHSHSGFMYSFGFSAWFGFGVAVLSIGISKVWKRFLKRKDTYYDE
ncbi:MAG: hypothetical protein CMM25_07445 [Rhodospirillaceae bacterium]|nr:hypothetical protein [Rhodospirillaceae bacterium]|tara:strand:+ start:497 stop:745 length:249 start_codon:yes stop_codon:yes gene_type:complete